MTHIQFLYQFHAVGQGLFASGHLHDYQSNRQFHWVFDCGTSSRRAYVQREISRFRPHLNGEPIGLFCLSHFDEDHINGARELLSQQRVEVLVMPYFPLVERIQIAFATPGLSDDYLRFLVDPAGYMFTAAGDNLGEVILIGGGGGPPEEGDESVPANAPDNPDDRWNFNSPDTKLPEPPAGEDIHGVSDPGSWRAVRVYGHQKPFTVGGAWEFVFFNEKIPDAKATDLRKDVAEIIKKHWRSDGSFDGTGLLRELKPLYVRKFGSSGLAQNRISLVTYSGPIKTPRARSLQLCGSLLPVGIEAPLVSDWCRWWHHEIKRLKVSIGYFGDFPLTSPDRVRDVRRHFGRWRWNRLQVVQVPHHGSSHSWYEGASGEFQHEASVISSARHSAHHPSQSVLDDLATHGVLLVNEMQRAKFCGHVEFL
jgi:hypothetical protein